MVQIAAPDNNPLSTSRDDLILLRMCLEYARRTEADSVRYYQNIMSMPLSHNGEFVRFLHGWLSDEMRHAGILADLLSLDLFSDIPSTESDSLSRPLSVSFAGMIFRLSHLARELIPADDAVNNLDRLASSLLGMDIQPSLTARRRILKAGLLV